MKKLLLVMVFLCTTGTMMNAETMTNEKSRSIDLNLNPEFDCFDMIYEYINSEDGAGLSDFEIQWLSYTFCDW